MSKRPRNQSIEKRRERNRVYSQSEKGKETRKKYNKRPDVVQKRKEYNALPKIKQRKAEYNKREDVKERRKNYALRNRRLGVIARIRIEDGTLNLEEWEKTYLESGKKPDNIKNNNKKDE